MSTMAKRKSYWAIVIIMVLLCILFISYLCISSSPSLQNKKLLKKYGWEVLKGGKDSTFILSDKLMKEEITVMQIDASKKIGFDPAKYEEKSVARYDYSLQQLGKNNPLRAQIWMYKNKIICAFILHGETNTIIKYWPLNAPYQTIQSELRELKLKDK